MYIDDFLLIGDDEKWLEFLENFFIHMFEMFKLSFIITYTGLQFIHVAKGIFLFQHNYIVKILEQFEMNNYDKFQTPMVEGIHFMFEVGTKEVNKILYEQMVGSFIFLSHT